MSSIWRLPNLFTSDCETSKHHDTRIGENVTFTVHVEEDYHDIWVYRANNQTNKPVMIIYPQSDTWYDDEINIKKRPVVDRHEKEISITLINVRASEGGTYYIKASQSIYCHTVFISGKYHCYFFGSYTIYTLQTFNYFMPSGVSKHKILMGLFVILDVAGSV